MYTHQLSRTTGPHPATDCYGRLDHYYYRCESCGLETTGACFGRSYGQAPGHSTEDSEVGDDDRGRDTGNPEVGDDDRGRGHSSLASLARWCPRCAD